MKRLGLIALIALLAVACGDKSTDAPIAKAKGHLERRDFAAAVIELKSALQQTPTLGEARYLLGVALLQQGDASAALLELNKAQEQHFDENQLSPKLARALLASGKYKEVIKSYAGVKVTDAQAELSTAVAIAYLRAGQVGEAEATIEEALRADPGYPQALVAKARMLAGSAKLDDALELLERALTREGPAGNVHLLRAAIYRIGKKDSAAAVKALEAATADPATVVWARGSLIQLHFAERRPAEAKWQLAELKKSHPKHAVTNYLDAMLSYADKDFARAEAITDSMLRIVPDSPQVLILGGASSLQMGSFVAAETKLGRVVQTKEGLPVARKLLAETYLRQGQAEKALSILKPLIDGPSPDADTLSLAGQAHLELGQLGASSELFSSAVRLKPNDVQAQTALAMTDLVRGKSEAAFDALQAIAAKDPGETADLALIGAYLRTSDHERALVAIAGLEKKLPRRALSHHLRGVALEGKRDLPAARASYEAALRIEPGYYASTAALAALDLEKKQFEPARARLQAAVLAAPANTAARMALLGVLIQQGASAAERLSLIDDAIKAAPTDGRPYVARIAHFANAGDPKAAVGAAQSALAALPDNPDVLDAAGRAMANAGDKQQAISAFNKLAAALPRSPAPYLRMADVHGRSGDLRAVSSTLARAFEIAPESLDVQQRWTALAVSTKDFASVLAAAKDLQRRRPATAGGNLFAGDIEVARKNWGAAIAAYRAGVGKLDLSGRLQRVMHETLLLSGDQTAARRYANDWIKAHPDDTEYLEYLGGKALLRQESAEAEQWYGELLARRPTHAAALNNLAWLMAARGAKGAVAMAERALLASPNAAPVLDTLAKALASEGQVQRAIEVQLRTIQAMPERSEYRLNLAKLYMRAGDKEKASIELALLRKLGDKFGFQSEVGTLSRALGTP
jgi:cellulose synthase operon protein C